MMNTFSADINAIIQNEGTSAERAAVQHFIGHAQALRSELTVAAAKAQRQPARAEISIMTNDLDTMTSGLQAVLHDDTSQISPVIIANTALTKEGTSLLSLCPASVLLSVAHPAASSCRNATQLVRSQGSRACRFRRASR
jgi:hypothetical protein